MREFSDVIRRWSQDAERFVTEGLCVEHISAQQAHGLAMLSLLCNAKYKRGKNEPLTPEERAVVDKVGISIQSGKGCHALGTSILMHDGSTRPVEQIRAGDRLMGDDSIPRIVRSLVRGHGAMFRVQYRDGTYYDVNEDHLLCLRHDTGSLLDISVRDFLARRGRHRKYRGYRVAVEFPPVGPPPIDPYILGLWLGDGSKTSATIFNVDPEVIAALRAFGAGRGLRFSTRIRKEHSLRAPRGQKNSFITDLRWLGVWDNKHIPDVYLRGSSRTRLQLLAGLIDSDGTLDRRKKRVYSIVQKRRALAEQIQSLARSLGIHCTLRPVRKRWQNGVGTYYELSVTRNVEIIPARVLRKQARRAHRRAFGLNFGITITPLGPGEYFGFSLSGNGRFCLADYTVTHNTGKDSYASWAILWMLVCFPHPKIPCTAPTQHQLRDVLWGEIAKWIRHSAARHRAAQSSFLIDEWITWQSDRVFFTDAGGKEWFAVGRTANPRASVEEQHETLSGFHEDFLMVVADEAASIPNPVFNQLEDTLTGKVNFAVIIFNPTRRTGFAIDTQTKERGRWIALHWDAEESELVPAWSIADKEKKYGRDSNQFRVTVKGLPPLADDDILIPYEMVMDAVAADDLLPLDTDPEVVGIDVGAGSDPSIYLLRHGPIVKRIDQINTDESEQLSNWCLKRLMDDAPMLAYVDVIGVGWGIAGNLRARSGVHIVDLKVSEVPAETERFHRLRDELYWRLREQFEHRCIRIPDDDILIGELTTLKKNEDSGRVKVEGKKELKRRGLASPNRADALALTEYYAHEQLRRLAGRSRRQWRRPVGTRTWRTV